MDTVCERMDNEYSEIGEKPEVGFLDFVGNRSLPNFDPRQGPLVTTIRRN